MTQLYVTLYMVGVDLYERAHKTAARAKSDRGSVTLEQVLITAALAVLALAAVAAIGVAVRSAIARI